MAGITGLALTLAGCAGQDAAPPGQTERPSTATAEPTTSEDHNDADTEFAQMMIVHHQGAVEMADLVAERAATAQVRDLAVRISAAQGPEIAQMTAWLQAWGEDAAPDADMAGMDHGGMDMGGLDQDGAMSALEGATGGDVDRVFLQLMIEHHRGAIEMAQTQVTDGQNPRAVALARDIIDAQEAQIAEMGQMLATSSL